MRNLYRSVCCIVFTCETVVDSVLLEKWYIRIIKLQPCVYFTEHLLNTLVYVDTLDESCKYTVSENRMRLKGNVRDIVNDNDSVVSQSVDERQRSLS